MPLNIKFKIGNDKIRFIATAGNYFGIGVSATERFGGENVDLYDKKRLDRFDFGFCSNVGMELGGKFTLNVGFQAGMIDLARDYNGYSNEAYLGTFQFSVGYFF